MYPDLFSLILHFVSARLPTLHAQQPLNENYDATCVKCEKILITRRMNFRGEEKKHTTYEIGGGCTCPARWVAVIPRIAT